MSSPSQHPAPETLPEANPTSSATTTTTTTTTSATAISATASANSTTGPTGSTTGVASSGATWLDVPPASAVGEAHAPTTQAGTQISEVHPGFRSALDSARQGKTLLSSAPASDAAPGGPTSTALQDRLRAIEHHLERLDARMRLLEKGLERSPEGRGSLVWWVVLGLVVLGWAMLSRPH